jgi:putative restriction endonuclease
LRDGRGTFEKSELDTTTSTGLLQPVLPDSIWPVFTEGILRLSPLRAQLAVLQAPLQKLSNFASFDPAHRSRNVRGLSNTSDLDRELWKEFEASPNRIAQQSEDAINRLSPESGEREPNFPEGPSERPLIRSMRLVQSFFRRSVLASYGYKCSFCGLEIRELLNASHIIPWNVSVELRAHPSNGFCLCVLHDRAFDRGLLSVDADGRLLISKRVKKTTPLPLHRVAFLDLEGQRINLPGRFLPDEACLEYHRTSIFR